MKIPVFKPSMNKEKIFSELEKIFDSGWIGLGPKTEEFEKTFATYHGARYGSALNSATSALHLALLAADVKAGDEVIVPTMTFASTALVALYEKAVPVFADCDYQTLNITPQEIEKRITPKTKAIIAVHFGGHAVELDEIKAIAKSRGIALIEDCAHAAGASYKGRKVGNDGQTGCFSFHAVKNLPTGDGGMITMQTEEVYRKVKSLRWLGIDKDTWSRSGGKYAWKYSIDELGYKYHMNDISSVIGLAQLEKLDEHNSARRRLALRYQALLKDVPELELPVEKEYAHSSWHNFVVKVGQNKRDDLFAYLAEFGISTGVHYEPIHHHKVFHGKSRMENLSVAEDLGHKLLTLPLYPSLSDAEHDFVVSKLKSFFKR